MRLSKILAAILLCATTLTLPPATTAVAAASRPSQKTRARVQAPAPLTEITKETVEAIIAELEQAAKKKDVAVVVRHLAPDFTYKLETSNRPTREANRAQYIEVVKLGMSVTLDYKYLRKSLDITIAPDGQSATAQTEAFEMVTLAQGTVAGNVSSLATFKLYKGKILLSSVAGSIEYV